MFRSHSAIAVQLRVLFALVMREMATRYGKSAGGYVWAILEPLIWIALFSAIFGYIARNPPIGEHFPLFYATGYLPFHLYMEVSNTVGMSVQVNKNLMSFPRITLIDAVLSRFILQIITNIVVSFVILSFMLRIFDDQTRIDLGPLFTGFGLAALFGLGVGAFNCVLFAYSPTWQRIFGIVNRPMFLISGVFFTYESLPREARDILWWNPLIHAVGLAREAFYPIYEAGYASVGYAVGIALLLIMLGILLLRALRAEILDG